MVEKKAFQSNKHYEVEQKPEEQKVEELEPKTPIKVIEHFKEMQKMVVEEKEQQESKLIADTSDKIETFSQSSSEESDGFYDSSSGDDQVFYNITAILKFFF